jgi:uncharacterized Zn finger protein
MPFWDDPDYSKSGPIRVENGIRARSRRGDIGSSWWSRRFIAVLESLKLGGRLARGRSYARSGQVLALEVRAGAVLATVQGSRPRPYTVRIKLGVLKPKQWAEVEREIAGQAIYRAKLLAGEMPEDLEDVFAELGVPLFPASARELTMTCTCPDDSVPCKHVAAVLYLLAEAFDGDPFLVLAWRGRDKDTLLRNLRSSTVDTPRPSTWDELLTAPGPPLAECVERYFACQARITPVDRRPAGIVVPDAVLRERDPLPISVRGTPVTDLLRPAFDAMGRVPDEP